LAKIEGKTGVRYIWRANLTASEKFWEGKIEKINIKIIKYKNII